MIRINLLPYRAARKKENIRFQVNVFLGSLIIIALVIFWYNSHLSGRIKNLNKDIADTRTQIAKYQEINREIAEIKQKLELLNRKIEVISSLESDRKAPVQNLDSLYVLLVEKRMWYTQIDEKGKNIRISGIAVDNQTVADYLMRLENSERFENVRLSSIKQQNLQKTNLNLKQFEVSFLKKQITENADQVKKQ